MGKWYTFLRLQEIANQIKQDVPLIEIYQDDVMSNSTFAIYKRWWDNLKVRYKKYFNFDIRQNIPLWTKNHKKILNNFLEIRIIHMKKIEEIISKIIQDNKSQNFTKMYNSLFELIGQNCKTVFSKNMLKSLFVKTLKMNNKNINIRKVLKDIELPKTTYYRNINISLDSNNVKKIRSDCKFQNDKYIKEVRQILKDTKKRIGINKICVEMMLRNINLTLSTKTCWKLLNHINESTKAGECYKNKRKFKESKDTKINRINHLTSDTLNSLKPLESTSVDYTIIKHSFYNHLHILGYIDPISNYVYDLRIYENQSTKDVLRLSKKLPKSVKIIHSDNGSEFTSKLMYDYSVQNNILLSFSRPGCSIENRWIEYFWGRLKNEHLNHENIENLSLHQIQNLLNEYKDFWNKSRRISTLDWKTPTEIISNYLL